jgi:RecA/RadA recombinase
MIHIIRDPAVAAQFRMMGVSGDDFRGTAYAYLAPVWEAVRLYMDRGFSSLPSYDALIAMLSQTVSPETPPSVIEYLGGFVRKSFAVPADDLRSMYVMAPDGPLHAMGVELRLAPALRVAATETNPGRVMKALNDVEIIKVQTQVAAAQHADITSTHRIRELTTVSEVEETGLDFWDRALGGMPKSCAAGFLAVTGGGKTTFAVQLAVESVLRGRNVMFFAYEQQLDGDLVERVYRSMTHISRSEMAATGYTPEVIARIQQVSGMIDQHFHIFQMAGDVEGQGAGGPPEIDAIINNYIRRYDWRPSLVILDWLEPILRRWATVGQLGIRDYQKQLKYVLDAMKQLRDKFATKVVILHQIAAAQAEKMTPAHMPDHYMAAEIKSFADLLNVACALGKADPATGCMHANWTKCRWAKPNNRVVKLDAENDRILDCAGMELNPDWRGTDEHAFRQIPSRAEKSE